MNNRTMGIDRVRPVLISARTPAEVAAALGVSRSWVYWWLASLDAESLIDLRARAIEAVETAHLKLLVAVNGLDAVELTERLRALPDPWLLRSTSDAANPTRGKRPTHTRRKKAAAKTSKKATSKKATSKKATSKKATSKKATSKKATSKKKPRTLRQQGGGQ